MTRSFNDIPRSFTWVKPSLSHVLKKVLFFLGATISNKFFSFSLTSTLPFQIRNRTNLFLASTKVLSSPRSLVKLLARSLVDLFQLALLAQETPFFSSSPFLWSAPFSELALFFFASALFFSESALFLIWVFLFYFYFYPKTSFCFWLRWLTYNGFHQIFLMFFLFMGQLLLKVWSFNL